MTRAPDWTDVQRRKRLAGVGFEQTLGLRSIEGDRYVGKWLDLSTFALLHRKSHIRHDDHVVSFDERTRLKYRSPLPPVDYKRLTQVAFQEFQSIRATERYDPFSDHAERIETGSQPLIVTYGTDENFWQSLAAFELANREYIVFPEALNDQWPHGLPDSICFKLGRLQEVLADIGVIPGGASLPEIALRAKYEHYDPTHVDAVEMMGVIEAKGDGNAKRGKRELADYRGQKEKSPYMDGGAVERGWLVSPNASDVISSHDSEIGGMTWENQHVRYFEPPQQPTDPRRLNEETQRAKRYVLDTVLRQWKLPCSLDSAIETCLEDPERLYTYFTS